MACKEEIIQVVDVMKKLLEDPLMENNLHTLSKNLGGCKFQQGHIDDQAVDVLNTMCDIIQWWTEGTTRVSPQQLQLAVRVILQVVQSLQGHCLGTNFGNELHSRLCIRIEDSLLQLIDNQKCSVECAMLAGTCLIRFIHFTLNSELVAGEVFDLVSHNGTSTSSLQISNRKLSLKRGTLTDYSTLKRSNFLSLALMNGLLNSGCFDLLLQPVGHQPLLWAVFPLVCDFSTSAVDHHFNAFQVLLAWLRAVYKLLEQLFVISVSPKPSSQQEKATEHWSAVVIHRNSSSSASLPFTNESSEKSCDFKREVTSDIEQISVQAYFCKNSPIFIKLFDIISKNWENFVQGVPDIVFECFQLLLDLHAKESNLRHVKDDLTLDHLVTHHMQLPWTTKRKYPPLAALIPFYGATKFLQHYPEFPMQLIETHTSNPLASAGTDVYRVLLQSSRKENPFTAPEEVANHWKVTWLKPFLFGLQSKNSLVEQNVLRYWVPWTLKIVPETYSVLVDGLSFPKSTSFLMAKMTVMKHARQTGMVLLEDMAVLDIQEALFHACEDLRIQAFALICSCHRKAEPVSATEMLFALEFLRYNLNIDSAPFRQQLINNAKTLLVRLRDSAISLMSAHKKKRIETEPEQLLKSVEFVQSLLELVISNLVPGVSYQRRQTCLDLLQLLLELFRSAPDPCKRKGAVPVKTPTLCAYAQGKGLWNFYSESILESLLCCLLDFMSEIKHSAIRILATYFPWNDPQLSSKLQLLMKQAELLATSPKHPVCESGALLTSLVLNHYFMSDKCLWLQHLQQMVITLKKHLELAQENMLLASKSCPMHGLVMALRLSLVSKDYSQLCVDPQLKQIISDLLVLNEAIVQHVLSVLASKSSGSSTIPSFAEMGEAIDDIIEVDVSTSNNTDSAAIPLEHQLVLSCCWLSLKECSSLAGSLTCSLKWSNVANPGLLTLEQVRSCGRLLVDVLTRCRHRGAIEACSISLGEYCRHLLESSSAEYETIVSDILQYALDNMKSSENTSATRRSAGLPLLMLAVVTSEPCSRHRPLFELCVQTLLQIASMPELSVSPDTVDLPQAHALHILRSLVQDASLSQAILPHITKIICLCISCFAHPSWTVRNAALQLYGSVIPRILGQKKVKDELSHHNSLTADVFFHRYPDLQEYLKETLSSVTDSQEPAHPCIVPILSLLSRLSPTSCSNEKNRIFTTFSGLMKKFLQSPIFMIRRLAAEAIVALNTESESELLDYFVFNLRSMSTFSTNTVHGYLLVLQTLMSSPANQSFVHYGLDKIAELEEKLGLCEDVPVFIRGMYWAIVNAALEVIHSVPGHFIKVDESHFISLNEIQEAGTGLLVREMACTVLKTAFDDHFEEILATCFDSCIHHQDFVLSGLTSLKWKLRGTVSMKQSLVYQHLLVKLMCTNPHPYHMHISIEIMIELLLQSSPTHFHKSVLKVPLVQMMVTVIQGQYGTLAAASGTVLLGLMLREALLEQNFSDNFDLDFVLRTWCKQLLLHSHPLQAEDLKLKAAQSLKVANPDLLIALANGISKVDHEEVAVNIFDTAVMLLTDENCDVRHAASEFTAILPRPAGFLQFESILSNYGIDLLFGYFVKQFWQMPVLLNNFWQKICNVSTIQNIVSQQLNQTRNIILFEQEEINIYAEHPMLVRTVTGFIEEIVKRQRHSELHCTAIENWIEIKVKEFLSELSELFSLPAIQQEKVLLSFSAVCETKIFLVILKLRCRAKILQKFVDDEDTITKLLDAAEKLKNLCIMK